MVGIFLSVALARAGDGYLASQVGDEVRSRHAASNRTYVVVVDSALDVPAFERAVRAAPWVRVSVLVPGGLDATRAATGMDCALHVTRAGAGNFWAISESGNCAREAGPVVVAPPSADVVAPAPQPDLVAELVAIPTHAARKARLVAMLADPAVDPAVASRLGEAIAVVSSLEATKRTDATVVRLFLRGALHPDPAVRQAAVAAARANGDPPLFASDAVAVVPVGVVSPAAVAAPIGSPPVPQVLAPRAAPDPAQLRRYKEQHLVRGEMSFTTGGFSDGHGYVATSHTWAVRDGGGAPYKTLAFARTVGDTATVRKMEKQRKTATVTAVVLGTVGTGMVIGGIAALDVDKDITGPAAVAIVGEVMALSGLVPIVVYSTRNNVIGGVYTTAQADQWIERYNAALRTRLGLTEADVQSIDLAN